VAVRNLLRDCKLAAGKTALIKAMHCLLSIAHKVGWDGLTAIATVALVLIGGLAAAYAKGQLADFRREARVKHLIELLEQFEREPLALQRRKLGQERTIGDQLKPLNIDNPPYELHDILNYFEHMGYLLDEGYLDLQGVSTEFHYWIFHMWADARELVKYEQSEDPIYYVYFEKMVERLAESERRRLDKFEFPSQEDIADFYAEEAHLPTGSPIPRQRRRKRKRRMRAAREAAAEQKASQDGEEGEV
jgi:hypothetical protein